MALDARDADAWTQLGVAAAIRGDLVTAKERLERALKVRPDHPAARAKLQHVLSDLRMRGRGR